MDLIKLTKQYVAAFDSKNIEKLKSLIHEDIVLTDPAVSGLTPRSSVLDMMEELFYSSQDHFSFIAKNIFRDDDVTLIEFELILNTKLLKGVDVLHWSEDKIIRLDAYLY